MADLTNRKSIVPPTSDPQVYSVEERMKDMADGTYSQVVSLAAELRAGACKSCVVTLSAGVADILLPDTAVLLGMKASTTGIRANIGEAPEAEGAGTGANLAVTTFAKGNSIPDADFEWQNLPKGTSRRLYFTGTGTVTLKVR